MSHHTLAGGSGAPFQFTNIIPWWEKSPELTKPQELQQELCRLESYLTVAPCCPGAPEAMLGEQCPQCLPEEIQIRRVKGVCLFSCCLSHMHAGEKCICQSQSSASSTPCMALFCRHAGRVPHPWEKHCWTVYAKIHHLQVSTREEDNAGAANVTQLQTDR